MINLKIISADSHSSEPDDLIQRLPVEYRDRAPHVEVLNGKRYWVAEGAVPISVPSKPYNDPEYEPLWTTVAEMAIPLSFHILSTSHPETDDPRKVSNTPTTLYTLLSESVEAMRNLCLLVEAGVYDRHPKLHFVLVECDIGWLAWVLKRIDERTPLADIFGRKKLPMPPSEYVRRQGHFTFQDDAVGLQNRRFTGIDCLMWGSDYPHDEGTFPHTRETIARIFRDIPEEETRKMVGGTAAKLYGFNLN